MNGQDRFRTLFDHASVGMALVDKEGRLILVNEALGHFLGRDPADLAGRHFAEVTYPEDLDADARLYDSLMRGERTSYTIDKRYVHADGKVVWGRLSLSLVMEGEGAPTHTVAICQDIDERKRAETHLLDALAKADHGERLLLALGQAAQSVLLARTPQEVYETVGAEIASLGFMASILVLADNDHLSLVHVSLDPEVLRAAEQFVGLMAETVRVPVVPGGLLDRVLTGTEVLFEPAAGPLIESVSGVLGPFVDQLIELVGLRQSIVAPLIVAGAAYGLLVVNGSDLAESDMAGVAAFANQAAIALENARHLEEVRAANARLQDVSRRLVQIQEAERRHIARELHDEVGQILTALNLLLEISARTPGEEAGTRLREARELVGELMDTVQNLSLDLRPTMLDDLGLLPALLWLQARYTSQTGVQVELEHSGLERRFAPDIETGAYRVVQEALTNVARHARVRRVTVRIWSAQDRLVLHVLDHGAGFDPVLVLARQDARGLAGMRERIDLLGGHLMVESSPGLGCRMVAEFPLNGRGPQENA